MWTVPNLITISRMIAAPALFGVALAEKQALFLAIGAWIILSDVLDGRIAHATGTASEFGARLDSAADCAVYLSAPFALLAAFPWLRADATYTMVGVFLAYAIPVVVGFARFGRLTSYHTVLARFAGIVLYAAFGVSFVLREVWPLNVALCVLAASAAEEVALTLTLEEWRTRIPSLLTVRRERHAHPSWRRKVSNG